MPGTRPKATKRKAQSNPGGPKTNGPAKLQRTTLDAFFAPRQTVPGPAAEETITEKKPLSKSPVEQRSAGRRDFWLSAEQQTVLRMVVDDERNIFFTGSAGRWHDLAKIRMPRTPVVYHGAD